METKRIFVLGNGFDLAHYLPTAYVHFMDAMKIVESSGEDTELGFDNLFQKYVSGKCSERDKDFFQKTKELYETDDLRLSVDTVNDLREKLKSNGWFQHFKHHLNDVDTWIDFENEIEKVLRAFNIVFNISFDNNTIESEEYNSYVENEPQVNLKDILKKHEKLFNTKLLNNTGMKVQYYLRLLQSFRILYVIYGYILYEISSDYGRHGIFTKQESYQLDYDVYTTFETYKDKRISESAMQSVNKKLFNNIIDTKYLRRNGSLYISFNEQEIFKKLLIDLDDFSRIFTGYIDLVVNKLNPVTPFYAFDELGHDIESVYTFNYSNTFERLYPKSFDKEYDQVQYIHGSAVRGNIVLGISDLDEKNLKKYKIYGFVKVFQKLINNTDYKFLYNTQLKYPKSFYPSPGKQYEIIIWGHSLDASDAEYVREMFALNDDSLLNRVVIEVWFHGSPHTQLANLIHIMGKDIIQEWMKKGWLSFKTQAPNVYELNKRS